MKLKLNPSDRWAKRENSLSKKDNFKYLLTGLWVGYALAMGSLFLFGWLVGA